MSSSSTPRETEREEDMTRSYIRVVIVWLLTLLGLLAFQEYFR